MCVFLAPTGQADPVPCLGGFLKKEEEPFLPCLLVGRILIYGDSDSGLDGGYSLIVPMCGGVPGENLPKAWVRRNAFLEGVDIFPSMRHGVGRKAGREKPGVCVNSLPSCVDGLQAASQAEALCLKNMP